MNFYQILISLWTITNKEIKRFIRIWPQTLLPSSITTLVYFLVFGKLIGYRVKSIEGFSYIDYIVPGLIMVSIITNSYNNVASSLFNSKFQRSIEEIIISPVPNIIILLGYIIGGSARGLLIGIIISFISIFFTKLNISHPILTIIIIIVTSILFSLAGFMNALIAKKFDDISIIPTFILTPLSYLGGIFYSIKSLPYIWQCFSLINPIFYIINLFRYSILGISDINIIYSLYAMFFFVFLFFIISYFMLIKGIGIKN